jgi:HPt (histidine-containing phosphotransfer) domain-containing protein
LHRPMRSAFVIEGPRLLEAAWRGLDDGDATALALAAHSLMGGAAFLGAGTVRACCARIERLADAGELGAARPELARLTLALTQVLVDMAPDVAPAADTVAT